MNLSIVIPVFNEHENLPLLFNALYKAIPPLKLKWEVIFVNDGSFDNSFEILKAQAKKDPQHVRVINFTRNFGQTAAIAAGIDHASGDTIVLMDADLQNDPSDVAMLLAKLDEGFDLVSGWRRNRKDNAFTRNLPSMIANRIISKVTGVHLHDYGCTLKAYRKGALQGFRLYGEMHRFIPVFANSVGAKITEVQVNHHPRRFGKTKYGLERTIKVILDLFTVKFLVSYGAKPIYVFGGAGMGLIFGSLLLGLYLIVRRFIDFPNFSILGSPFFQLGVMFFILGFQSILMGLIAELLVRTYYESQQKTIYMTRDLIGFNKLPAKRK